MVGIPGPNSRALLARLKAHESPNVTAVGEHFPIVWQSASGATVVDVDGNEYLDGSGAFGVAFVGHGHPLVVEAACKQTRELMHGMGDVHPPAVRIELLARLAAMAPGDLGHGVLCTGGSEAVEVAIKTALLATGKPGIIAFEGGYHGLSIGALAVTSRDVFRRPFLAHLPTTSYFAPFGHIVPSGAVQNSGSNDGGPERSLAIVEKLLADQSNAIGLLMVEPILGRGGTILPAPGWLAGLRALCDRYGALLCCDEIFTGLGRTGSWFASDFEAVLPDLMCLGKALGGGFPISVCLGRPAVMASWGPAQGEALHTSTFLGHPVACAAALAALGVIESQSLVTRAGRVGEALKSVFKERLQGRAGVVDIRGRGLMLAIELGANGHQDARERTFDAVIRCLKYGLIVLAAGPRGDVLQLTPPAVCTDRQFDKLADIVCRAVTETCT